MRTGGLDKRITLQKPVYNRNSFNELEASYIRAATVWGSFLAQSGRLVYEAKQANSEVQGVVRIRYNADIQPDWRLQYGTRILKILSIINIREQDRELLIAYKEARD